MPTDSSYFSSLSSRPDFAQRTLDVKLDPSSYFPSLGRYLQTGTSGWNTGFDPSETNKYAWGQSPESSAGSKWGDVLRLAGTALQDYNKQRSGFGDYGQYGGGSFGGGAQKVGDLTFVWPQQSQPYTTPGKQRSGLGSVIGSIGGAALGSIVPGVGTALGASLGGGVGGLFG